MDPQLHLPWGDPGLQLEIALKQEPELQAKDFRCKNCQHLLLHQYNPAKYKYCQMQRDPRTSYGFKKIKANDLGCSKFKKIEK